MERQGSRQEAALTQTADEQKNMQDTQKLASLIGPTLMAIALFEWLNLDIWRIAPTQSLAPVMYLNGVIFFVAGLAVVRAHNRWELRWPLMITLTGWAALLEGLIRMAAPTLGHLPELSPIAVGASFSAMLIAGAFLTFRAYRPGSDEAPRRH